MLEWLRRTGVLIAAVGLALSTGCFSSELLYLPVNLFTPDGSYKVTRIADPGPMERRLYAAADRTGRQRVIADTRDPASDPKRIARRCDAGDAAACTQTARLFAFALDEAPLALKIWQKACDRGDPDSCMRVADALSTGCQVPADLARAHAIYRHVCETFDRPARACRHAVEFLMPNEYEMWPPGAVPRPALVFPMLDLACRRGDEFSCRILSSEFDSPYGQFAVNPVLAKFYAEKDRELLSYAPPRKGAVAVPNAEVDAARERVERGALRHEIRSGLRFVPRVHPAPAVLPMWSSPRPGSPLSRTWQGPEHDLAPLPVVKSCLLSCPGVIPTDSKDEIAAAACFCGCLLEQDAPIEDRKAVEACAARGTSGPPVGPATHPDPGRAHVPR